MSKLSLPARIALPLLLSVVVAGEASAATIASSDFESDLDGWTTVGDGISSHVAAGGNPGGFLQSVDQPIGQNTDAFAPAKFLGDWSVLDGAGVLSADFRMVSACCAISEGMEFFISGPGGSASQRLSTATGPFPAWTTYSIDIAESAWNVSGNWAALLGDVTVLRIDMEHVGGDETTGLDNVVLSSVPEPSGVLLALAGLAGLSAYSARRGA